MWQHAVWSLLFNLQCGKKKEFVVVAETLFITSWRLRLFQFLLFQFEALMSWNNDRIILDDWRFNGVGPDNLVIESINISSKPCCSQRILQSIKQIFLTSRSKRLKKIYLSIYLKSAGLRRNGDGHLKHSELRPLSAFKLLWLAPSFRKSHTKSNSLDKHPLTQAIG